MDGNPDDIYTIKVSDLKKHIIPEYIDGFFQFQQTKSISDNVYLKFLFKLVNSIYNTKYESLDKENLKKICIERFNIFENIKSEYKKENCVLLIKNKFKNRYSVELSDGQLWCYGDFDGHHRLTAAHYWGLENIPAKIAEASTSVIDLKKLDELSKKNKWSWYQFVDFGNQNVIKFEHPNNINHSYGKFSFILKRNLEPIKGKQFLELGCNTGVLSACIAENEANNVVGIDYKRIIDQALVVHSMLWSNYGNLSFKAANIKEDIDKIGAMLEKHHFDCILMSNFIYYMGDNINLLLEMCKKITNKIVLQGNNLKRDKSGQSVLRLESMPNYCGEYALIDGMVNLLKRHGFDCSVDSPSGYSKPVVIGIK